MNKKPPHLLILTPGCQGADGLSAYSRLCIEALLELADAGRIRLSVWSLAENDDSTRPLPASVRKRFARGSKMKMLAWGASQSFSPPDLIFCTHMNVGIVALPAVWRGSRLITALLGVEAWRPIRMRDAFALRKAERLVSISKHTADRFHECNPALAKIPTEVCHLCLPLAIPIPASQPTSRPFALIVARMASEERYKGHDELIDVWPEVLKEVPQAELRVVGGGDDLDRLKSRTENERLVDHIRFEGRVPDDQLAQLYADCCFFVMPSKDEGFGLVFLEAMRAEKACIGAEGAASEIIQDGTTGIIVPYGDRPRLRAALVQLFRNPDRRLAMGKAGKLRESEHFSVRAFRDRLQSILGLVSLSNNGRQ